MNYSDCFWTATGDLDCHPGQFQAPMIQHSGHHLPTTGRELYPTVNSAQMEFNLGYQGIRAAQQVPMTGLDGVPGGPAYHPAQINGGHPPFHPAVALPYQTAAYQYGVMTGGGSNNGRYESDYGQDYSAAYGAGGMAGNPSYSVVAYKLPEMTRELGTPDIYDPSVGGIGVWRTGLRHRWGGIFSRVEVHDDQVPNMNPVVFNGHVYTWTPSALKKDFARTASEMFPFVWYDSQKRQLIVRTDSLDGNLGVLALLAAVNKGLISWRQVRSYDLAKKYLLSICPRSRWYNRYCRATYLNLVREGLLSKGGQLR